MITFNVEGTNVKSIKNVFDKYKLFREWDTERDYQFVQVFVLESYSLRVGSALTITVFLEFKNTDQVKVTILSSGGKSGSLNIGWGAEGSRERKIYKRIEQFARRKGWRVL